MKINDKIKLIKLFEIYHNLFTDKQQRIFKLYYFEDYSINEISTSLNITKNAVYNSLTRVSESLKKYEMQLLIYTNKEYNIKLLEKENVSASIVDKIK